MIPGKSADSRRARLSTKRHEGARRVSIFPCNLTTDYLTTVKVGDRHSAFAEDIALRRSLSCLSSLKTVHRAPCTVHYFPISPIERVRYGVPRIEFEFKTKRSAKRREKILRKEMQPEYDEVGFIEVKV
jgi:hypothetical protein